jgi:mono/diheme cytochrome c family protein
VYRNSLLILILVLIVIFPHPGLQADPGLAVEFRQGDKTDRLVLPYPALHTESAEAPSLFLEPGPFTAEFSGFISVDLRAQYTFSAESTAKLELLINAKEILATTDTSPAPASSKFVSKPVRLNKGTNAFLLRLYPVTEGAASIRLLWSSRNNAVPVPIPAAALTHTLDAGLKRSLAAHTGAFLIQQYRCANCHLTENTAVLNSPDFDHIGSRLHSDWITQWILNPSAQRPAHMPRLLRGPEAAGQAQAIAAYLSSLNSVSRPARPQENEAQRSQGETLFQDLRCGTCHSLPDEPAIAGRISLSHVAQKLIALPEFLQNPQAHYPSNPMPNFKLSSGEARTLSAFLLHRAPPPKKTAIDSNRIEKGKSLVQSTGCLNCHSAGLPNNFSAPAFSAIVQGNLETGCLAENPEKAPRFTFAAGEKEDIKAFFAMSQPAALKKSIPHEDALHLTKSLQCAQCHQDSGLPDPLTLGAKLKPEWAGLFIGGEVPYKPRPWLKTRMPAFPAYAKSLAAGLAAIHGNPSTTPEEEPPNPELVSLGAKLVSSAGGFSCVACHPIKDLSTAVVVESPGVNLAWSGERLLSSFFHRWLMNPIAIDPSTKMPVYFDTEGRSQLTEYFEGDAAKQIDAVWHYLRLGDKMPAPPTP